MRVGMKDPDLIERRRWLTLGVLCLSLMVIAVDNTILNVAIPTLARTRALGGLSASASQLQWIVDAYTVVFAGLLLTAGSLGDRFGRYKGLTLGLTVFGLGSMASALAPSAGVLIVTRSLMGIGGAFIMPSTLSILTNVFTNPLERGKAIGIWAGVAALGIGLGPLTGGFLLSHYWWGSVFLVNAPIVVLALVGGYFLIPESWDPSAPRLDPLGALLSISGLVAVLWAVIEAPIHGWGSGSILAGFAVGAGLLAAFMAWELHSSSPMLDIRFFHNPRFSAASGAVTLTFFALFGSIFLLTQYLQSVLGYSTLKAGAVLLPQAALMMIAAPLSSSLVQKVGSKIVVASGLGVVAVALLLFDTLAVDSSTLHVILVGMVLGVGMANVMAPATESIMGSLPRAKAGVGSAVNDTTRQVGGAVGVAVLGSILSSRYTSLVTAGLRGGVPADVLARARNNIGGAVSTGRGLQTAHAPYADHVLQSAKSAFVSGMHVSVLVAAAVTVVAAAGVAKWLPARAPDDPRSPGGEAARLPTSADRPPTSVDQPPLVEADTPPVVDVLS